MIPVIVMTLATEAATKSEEDGHPRVTLPGGFRITPTSVASLAVSISAVVQLTATMFIGPLGQFGNLRKRLLLTMDVIAGLGLCSFLFVYHKDVYWVGALLLIVVESALETADIFYQDYMKVLIFYLPVVRHPMEFPDIVRLKPGLEVVIVEDGSSSTKHYGCIVSGPGSGNQADDIFTIQCQGQP